MDMQILKQFIKHQTNLSTTPAMLGRILSLVRDEASSPDDLFGLISHDQAMAERVMRLANSAFFGHSGRVRDIPQAIMLLGYDRVQAVAIGMTAMDVFPSHGSFHIQNLWVHNYEVALLASRISQASPLTRPDECFLGGLLHDVGRVILYLFDHVRFEKLGCGDDLLERELEQFGGTHPEIGAWFGEHIGLPAEVSDVIRYHHAPSASKDNAGTVSVISLAEALCRKFNPRIEDDGIWTTEHDAILLGFKYTNDDLQRFQEHYDAARPEIERFF